MKTRYLPALLGLLLVGNAPGKTIPNNAIADLVLGQPNFTSSANPIPSSSFSLRYPSAVVVDPVSRKVFVTDSGNNRILRYPSVASLANAAGAEAVLGQTNFSGTTPPATGVLGLREPNGLFLDRLGRLWVADSSNRRVLMYEAAVYRASGTNPDRVYGQPDFMTVNTSGNYDAIMGYPVGVCVDAQDRLWVSDYSLNRVLRFDSISTKASGAPANGVLGQTQFIDGNFGSGSAKFTFPFGIAVTASGTLWVTDSYNNRVMRFDHAASLANGAAANAVLGQPDFTSTASGNTGRTLTSPAGVFVTADDSLWVCDSGNNRFLRYSHASTLPSGSAADGVVGQANFTTRTSATTNRGLSFPKFSPFVDATGSLWVPDFSNNRVLRFPPDVTRPTLVVTSSVPKSTADKTLSVKGTADDLYGVAKVTYRVNTGSTKTATGTTVWKFKTGLLVGKNTITINAVDSVGNKSTSKVLTIVRN